MIDKLLGPFLSSLLGFPQPPKFAVQQDEGHRISPEYVEQLIMSVGRQRVFARAKELGWHPPQEPPLWVWNVICQDLIREGKVDNVGYGPLQ